MTYPPSFSVSRRPINPGRCRVKDGGAQRRHPIGGGRAGEALSSGAKRSAWALASFACVLALLAPACGGDDGDGGAAGGAGGTAGTAGTAGVGGAPSIRSIYQVPASLDELTEERFFDHPWPSDWRLTPAGRVHLLGYPNPRLVPLLRTYIESMHDVMEGFSPVAAGYLRFDGPLDPSSLPAGPLESLSPESSVQLIDIDPASPERGSRRLLTLHWQEEEGVYWPSGTLAFMPALGHPLRRATRYALVVTSALRAADGGAVGRSEELEQLLGVEMSPGGALGAHKSALLPALEEITAQGVEASDVVHLAVFTTSDPVRETQALRDWVMDNYPAPTASAWEARGGWGTADIYEGEYGPSPDFQRGTIPFARFGDGGELAFDAQGAPELQRDFSLRFALMVPDPAACPMPSEGYPITLYAHGTGGNFRSFIGEGDEGPALAERCIATMGIDQIFHGTRPGADGGNPDILFFNVSNPVAARANGPQSAIDVVQQARLFTETRIEIPAEVSNTGAAIRFDPTRVMFMGHSQGGLNGPMFLAVDDQTRGAVLSGSASMISITLLEKTAPIDVSRLVSTVFLALTVHEQGELNELHPEISLAQSIVDPTDPIHYVPMLLKEPRAGFAPKSVLMTEGVTPTGGGDSYSPPHGIEVQAVALGLPPLEPVVRLPAELAWTPSLVPFSVPAEGLSGNLAGGAATGALVQWDPTPTGRDGHFVIYYVPGAMDQSADFLRNLADDPKGRLPPR
ncbi:MAG: hypothetical protein KF915_19965 [Polyangiaceae bacterium]|nr:hypothetical protein [Polyangiaceae bacterium]